MENKQTIKQYIEKGKSMIYPERAQSWEECVNNSFNSSYAGMDVINALEIMSVLHEGVSINRATDVMFNQLTDGKCFDKTLDIVAIFSKRGVEFYSAVKKTVNIGFALTPKEEEKLKKITAENIQYDLNSFQPK